jgi:RNA polymerase sigma-70 factor, ECF subfamily
VSRDDTEVDRLLRDAGRGDEPSVRRLFDHYRGRLLRMVATRLDTRLAPRVDPSDVVQDSLAEAAGKLDDFLRARPLPYYVWLRGFALQRVQKAHRAHIHTKGRSVLCEVPTPPLAADSAEDLADRLVASDTSPSRRCERAEDLLRMRAALARLGSRDREVLVLRYLEELSFAEVAAVLEIKEEAAKVRHFRALERVRKLFDEPMRDGNNA